MTRLRAAWCRWRYCRKHEHHVTAVTSGPTTVHLCLIPGCTYVEPWPWWR